MSTLHRRVEDDYGSPHSSATDPAETGLLVTLAAEHEHLSQLLHQAEETTTTADRSEMLSAVSSACRQRFLAAEMVLVPCVSEANPRLVESWRAAHRELDLRLCTAQDEMTLGSMRSVDDALDFTALVADPQLFMSSLALSGCLFSAELATDYRRTKDSLGEDYSSGPRGPECDEVSGARSPYLAS